MHIYTLRKGKPLVVTMPTNPAKIVVTDGFHITTPVQIKYTPQRKHFYTIACIIENDVLVGGAIFMLLLFFYGTFFRIYYPSSVKRRNYFLPASNLLYQAKRIHSN